MKCFDNLETVMQHFSKTGGFLTVKSGEAVNTMVVSWGFIGFLWGKPHFITVVRPQRKTKEILDSASSFTVSVPFGTMSEELKICGTKSGFEIDKSMVVNFVPSKKIVSPVVKGCDVYYECELRYADKFVEERLPEFVKSQFYKGDYHNIFLGEIVECYSSSES